MKSWRCWQFSLSLAACLSCANTTAATELHLWLIQHAQDHLTSFVSCRQFRSSQLNKKRQFRRVIISINDIASCGGLNLTHTQLLQFCRRKNTYLHCRWERQVKWDWIVVHMHIEITKMASCRRRIDLMVIGFYQMNSDDVSEYESEIRNCPKQSVQLHVHTFLIYFYVFTPDSLFSL